MRGLSAPTDIQGPRAAKDELFRRSPDPPLDHEQRHHFAGLRYYPEDPSFRFVLERAYNDAWRCPLPPSENWLDVDIPVGEKRFADHG
ncbi:MAG TPA: DUF1684 domain-containing protein [Candidatus Limnocylindria bacterium]